MFVNVWFADQLLSLLIYANLPVSLSVIQLLLAALIALILICWEADDAFNWVIELFKDAVVVFKLLIEVFTDAEFIFNALIDICAEDVNVFKLVIELTILAVD